MNKLILSLLVILSNFFFSNAQPAIQWQKCFGGTGSEAAFSIKQTTDGGFIFAGWTSSNDGDAIGNHGLNDCWIVKLDNTGGIQWQKCLGGSDEDDAYCIQQTTDGGYIVAGNSGSNNGDVTGNHGLSDSWIVKLDNLGGIQWQKCLGGTGNDFAKSVYQTTDGGYIIAGWTSSTNGDVIGNHGSDDYWIVKLNSSGSIQWQKCLGGTMADDAYSIQQTTDGGFIVAGNSTSSDGNVTGNHGQFDFWIVKLDTIGGIQWQRNFGGTHSEVGYSIQQTNDRGYIVGGGTLSGNYDVAGNHGISDSWIIKLDSIGTLIWQKCLGGSYQEDASSIQQTTDGGYIVAGYSSSIDGDVIGIHGLDDWWIVKLNDTGAIQWQKCLGGSDDDFAKSVQQTTDGGFIIAGGASSHDGDVMGGQGGCWIVKLSSTIGIDEIDDVIHDVSIYPNPITEKTIISFALNKKEIVSIKIFDISGRVISTLVQSDFEEGFQSISLNNTEYQNKIMENGIYILSIETQNGTEFKRFEVMK